MKEMGFLAMLIGLQSILNTLIGLQGTLNAQDATDIVRKANELMQGEKSSTSTMKMRIVRPTWERTVEMKNWTQGDDYALTLITAPARDKGQSFLKRKREMWNWNPAINRMIKLPPSMMSQGWMGSDFTNDDMMNQSSIVTKYTHSLLGNETINGYDCYKVQLIPLENTNITWGKVIMWISKDEYFQIKNEYYDEEDFLVKTHLAHDIKVMDNRKLPTRFEIIPAENPDQKTEVITTTIKFNVTINEPFFSQQNMKRVR